MPDLKLHSDIWLSRLALAVGAALFFTAVTQLGGVKRPSTTEEMQVALPRFVQVVMTAGDRFLAANIATFRATVASTENMREDNYHVQALVQRDAAWLNPAQEDNYYVAAAILPWNGEFDAAQEVLALAMQARPFDWQPAFYYAFDLYHFRHDAVAAADVLLQAAPGVSNEGNRSTMEALAYAWYEKGYDAATALQMMETSAKTARSGAFRRYLEARAVRLRGLLSLREAVEVFDGKFGRRPGNIEELVSAGVVSTLPTDPFGVGYELGGDGYPVIKGRGVGRKP